MNCTGVPFLWFFGHVRCCHPLVSLGLSALISPMSPLVGCFGFSIVVHLRIPSSFHVNCCTSFSHCCLLRAAVLSTSPNYSFSDFLEMVTFLIILFIEIYLLSKGHGLNFPSNEWTCVPHCAITNLASTFCIHVSQIIIFWSRSWWEAKEPCENCSSCSEW